MPYQDQITSLELISEHLNETITATMEALEVYHSKNIEKVSDARQTALGKIYQLNRVFSFIELKGAEQLSSDIFRMLKQMPEIPDVENEELLEGLIYGLTLLGRYIDFICSKPFDLPQLLFGPINDLRSLAGVPPFSESSFFTGNPEKMRSQSAKSEHLDDYEIVKTSRRLRQMYQMGLIEIIRRTNVQGGLNMMSRALKKLETQCGSPNSPNLWWIALGAVEGFKSGGLIINPVRIKLFARLDLQIRELGQVDHNLNYKIRGEAEKLSFELLYLVSLSDAKDDLSKHLKQHFELPELGLTERNLTQEFMLMKGLSEDDYDTLFQTILDDIMKVQTDLIAEEYEADSSELTNLHHQLKQLHSLFTVLEYKNLEISLKEASERIEMSLNKKNKLSDADRQFTSECLSTIESHLYEKKKISSEATPLQREKLSPEKFEACKNARQYVRLVISQLENYANNEHDPELLHSAPKTLQRAAEEVQQLNDNDMVQLIIESISVFDQYFVHQPATIQALELLADILVSIEFYLETREHHHTPSPKIHQFADENLAKLKAYLNL